MPELVGREEQQAAIDRLLDAARRGHSGALVVRGDAGIGKSALLESASVDDWVPQSPAAAPLGTRGGVWLGKPMRLGGPC